MDAVSHRVRYETKDENGETRADRNKRFSQPLPQHSSELIPDGGEYLWEWFFDLNSRLKRIVDGNVIPIPPSEMLAWKELHGHIVYSWELDILEGMDLAFCAEMGEELKAFHERQKDAAPKKRK